MSKCIGGIAHEAAGLATHQPSKSFGDLFEEKKACGEDQRVWQG